MQVRGHQHKVTTHTGAWCSLGLSGVKWLYNSDLGLWPLAFERHQQPVTADLARYFVATLYICNAM